MTRAVEILRNPDLGNLLSGSFQEIVVFTSLVKKKKGFLWRNCSFFSCVVLSPKVAKSATYSLVFCVMTCPLNVTQPPIS